MIEVKEVDIEEVLKVHKNIIEFDDGNPPKEFFEDRYKNLNKLILVAYYKNNPIGYVIGYERDEDKSFYCWLAGVDNNYRRRGALTNMMKYFMKWTKKNGYKKIKIKTRNKFREMLNYLVKSGWQFMNVEAKENAKDNRIELELDLI